MTDFAQQVSDTLQPYQGQRLVVAVSGGLDSVVLLDILLRLRDELELSLVVAHADHGLRAGSAKDAAFVRQLAAAYSLPYAATTFDLGRGGNMEARAREARYAWLEKIRRQKRADYIVTAHQADDQVETLFLHLTRGSGLSGLAGMRLQSDHILRPLLEIPRKQLARYARRHKLSYRTDPTNRSLRMARNRVRRQVITSLQKINPQLIETVSQSMRIFASQHGVLRTLAEQKLAHLSRRPGRDRLVLSRQKLIRLDRPLRQMVWREALRELRGDVTGLRLRHIENLDDLLARQTGSVLHLPGDLIAKRAYDDIALTKHAALPAPKATRLTIPGSAGFGNVSLRAKASRTSRAKASASEILIDRRKVGDRLLVRPPKVGDRFRPAGMRGSKLLSDLFTDAKVPKEERPWVPVVTTTAGDIVWVAGYRADRRFAAESPAGRVLLTLEP